MSILTEEFEEFLHSIYKGFNSNYITNLPKLTDFPASIFRDNKLDFNNLMSFIAESTDSLITSVSKRIAAILLIQKSRSNNENLDIDLIWKLVSESILSIPKEYTISSIGSQGFLSIPLYKNERVIENFEFIRLHIWDKSLDARMDMEKCEKFSIHTHSFFARSWIITGKVINNRYLVSDGGIDSEFSLFTVEYNNSLNKVNQHTSKAVNTERHVFVKTASEEVHMKGGAYSIMAGDYHKSGHKNEEGISATFFSFTAKDGIVDKSYVIGPRNINDSEINRKMYIDPTELFRKIDEQLLAEQNG